MKILKPSFEIWPQEPGVQGIYQQVERAGRVCYKSEDKRTAESARPFVERMIASQHTAMLEHGTVYLADSGEGLRGDYIRNRFSHVNTVDGISYITTNLRVLVENDWLDDLEKVCEPTAHHEFRVTVHFTTQIGTTREFNRHRANSMAEQSTRYCNYSKDKFGGSVALNLPVWVGEAVEGEWGDKLRGGTLDADNDTFVTLAQRVALGEANDMENWAFANLAAERAYLNLIAAGRKPQEARAVLPLDTNTELVHTAFVKDWRHFFDLRALGTTGAPHPDAKVLAEPLMEAMKAWLER